MGEHAETPDWIRLIAFFGLIVVVSGVFGEFVTEGIVSDADGKIQTFNNILLADATKDAGAAKLSAEVAAMAAARAGSSASQANDEALKAFDKSKRATAAASNALGLASTARQDVARAKEETMKLEAQVEDEGQKLLELRKFSTAREITILQSNGSSNTDPLKKFAGMGFIIETVQDGEALRAAERIAEVITSAGWKFIRVNPNPPMPLRSGVSVDQYLAPAAEMNTPEAQADQIRSCEAAHALASFLQDEGWLSVQPGFTSHGHIGETIPKNTVRIQVGLKPLLPTPLPTSAPQWAKDLEALREKGEKEFEKINKEMKDKNIIPCGPA